MIRLARVTLLLGLPLAAAVGQTVDSSRPLPVQGGGRRGGGKVPRPQLERMVGQAIANRARVVLNLTDDQMVKLRQVDVKYEQQQRAIDVREAETRRNLRETLQATASPDQERRAGELFDQLLQVQRQRLDVVEAEQHDLSGFLTNTQRARFQALREAVRRQLQDAAAAEGGRLGKPPTR